jgi:hypothetical protein
MTLIWSVVISTSKTCWPPGRCSFHRNAEFVDERLSNVTIWPAPASNVYTSRLPTCSMWPAPGARAPLIVPLATVSPKTRLNCCASGTSRTMKE